MLETVLSDPAEKVEFLRRAAAVGYTIVLCFIGVDRPEACEERIAMRVLQGGHDAPTEKVLARFPRTLANLARAIRVLPHVLVFDNSDPGHPCRKVSEVEQGHPIAMSPALRAWLRWD